MKIEQLLLRAERVGHLSPKAKEFFDEELNRERLNSENLFVLELQNTKDICELLNISWVYGELMSSYFERVLSRLLEMQRASFQRIEHNLVEMALFDEQSPVKWRHHWTEARSLAHAIALVSDPRSQNGLMPLDELLIIVRELVKNND